MMTKRQRNLVQIALLVLRGDVENDNDDWQELYGEPNPTGEEVDEIVKVLAEYVE